MSLEEKNFGMFGGDDIGFLVRIDDYKEQSDGRFFITVEGIERKYLQYTLKNHEISSKVMTEKVGSDKGKLVPTDIGNIVNDFLVENFTFDQNLKIACGI